MIPRTSSRSERKEAIAMKKVLACLLVMSLLPFGALSEGWFSALFGNADAPEFRYVSVPEKAFGEGNHRVLAASMDENFILI